MTVRPERSADREAVRRVHARAFDTEAEADLVERLRRDPGFLRELSLVAEVEGEIAGHVILSPVRVESEAGGPEHGLVGLGPIGVLPEHQRQGLGSALMREAISRTTEQGFAGIVLLGHPEYYPRFGFQPASRFGLRSTYAVPDDVFMALPLRPGALDAYSGLVRYSAPFDDL